MYGTSSNFLGNIKGLNITPLSISYEYDPCDYLKAAEFQLKRDDLEYKKQDIDDLRNMETGLFGFKGKVNFHIGNPINPNIDTISPDLDRNSQIVAVGKLIDHEIHKNYLIYPVNYIAYDLLQKTSRFSEQYTQKEKSAFKDYLNKCIDKIEISNKDVEFLTIKLLEMYANPLKNKLITQEGK